MDDRSVRQATFAWLDEQTDVHGYSLDRTLLAKGFEYQSEQIRLVGPQGIFKPKCLELPLSITTVAGGPYADSFRPDGLLSYRYRGTDPQHRDNVGLRNCLRQRTPLVYLHGIEKGTYVLQGLHHQTIVVPSREDQRPDRLALERRYQRFKEALPGSRRA